jgi:hypothetical protein
MQIEVANGPYGGLVIDVPDNVAQWTHESERYELRTATDALARAALIFCILARQVINQFKHPAQSLASFCCV